MTVKRFIEFATQNTNNGRINSGFKDIKTDKWYYTKDSENAKKICEILNELDERFVDEFSLRETLQQELQRVEEENEQLKKENKQLLCTIVEILDFIEDKREVSVEEMARWWKEKEKELEE